jgi:regulator of sigma E protease
VVQENGLVFGEVGKKVGFENGDKIISIDGKPIQENFNRTVIDVLLGDDIEINREGKTEHVFLTDENKGLILGSEGKNFLGPRQANNVIDTVITGSEASKAGLLKGDKIISVNKKTFAFYDQFSEELNKAKKPIQLTIIRKGSILEIPIALGKDGKIGISQNSVVGNEKYKVVNKYSFFSALPVAARECWQLLVYNVKQFKLILKPKTGAYKQVKSPIGIARMLPDTWDWEFIWSFTALFSIGLAFMNLLPIPGLDGGHALFTIVEMATGKTLGEKSAGYVQTGGMIILLSLMALTFGKDIYQLVADKFL